jgi:hypothetical protein
MEDLGGSKRPSAQSETFHRLISGSRNEPGASPQGIASGWLSIPRIPLLGNSVNKASGRAETARLRP